MNSSWAIVLILLIGLDDTLGLPEKGQKEVELPSNLPAEISEVLKSPVLDIGEYLKKSLVGGTSSNRTSSNIPPEKPPVVETPSDTSLDNTLKSSTPFTNLPELTVSEDQDKEVSTFFSDQPVSTKSLETTFIEDLFKVVTDTSIATKDNHPLSVEVTTQFSMQPDLTKSEVEIPLENQSKEATDKSLSSLVHNQQSPSGAILISSGVSNEIVQSENPLPGGPAVVKDRFFENNDISTSTIFPHPSVTTESPIEIPFKDQFEEATNKSPDEAPLANKPQSPPFASSISSEVASKIIPPRKPLLSDGPAVLKDRLPENDNISTVKVPLYSSVTTKSSNEVPFEGKPLPGGPAVLEDRLPENNPSTVKVPLESTVRTKSPIEISFKDQFEKVTNKSPNESPLVYKTQIPSFASLISSGVANQIIPPGTPLPDGPTVLEDRLPENDNLSTSRIPLNSSVTTKSPIEVPFKDQFEKVTKKSPNESPLIYKPQKPSFASSISSGIHSQIIPQGKPLPGGSAVLEDRLPENDNLSTSRIPLNSSVTTKSPIEVPFEDQFEEVTKKSPNESPLIYKPQKPSFASSISSGVSNQIIPPGKPLPGGPAVLEDRLPENDNLSTVKVPLDPLETTKSSNELPFKDQFEKVTNKLPNESPLVYKPQRPSFASSISSGVASQIIPPGKPLPDGPAILEDRLLENHNFSAVKVPLHFSVTTKSPIEVLLEDQFEKVTNKSPNESPLVYKPQRPLISSSISSGVSNQIIPPGKPLPGGSAVLEDRLSENDNLSTVKVPLHFSVTTKSPIEVPFEDQFEEVRNKLPNKSPLVYEPQRPSFASSISSGVPSQIIAPGKPLPGGPAVLKDRFSEMSKLSNVKVPVHSSVTTKSPIEILFEDQYEQVTNKVPNESSLVYKPQKPSSSVSTRVQNKPRANAVRKMPRDEFVKTQKLAFAPVSLNDYYQYSSPTSSILYETLKEKPVLNFKEIIEHKKFKNPADAKSSSPSHLPIKKNIGKTTENKPLVHNTDLLMLRELLEYIKADEKKFQDLLRADYLKARGDIIQESRGPRRDHLENHLPRKNRVIYDVPERGPLLNLLSRKKILFNWLIPIPYQQNVIFLGTRY